MDYKKMNEELKDDIFYGAADFWAEYNYNCTYDDYGFYELYDYEQEWIDDEE